MGLMDSFRAKLSPAKDKVSGLAHQHGDKIQDGLDKAAKVVDEKTKGKYSGRIQTGTSKAKDAMDRLAAHKDGTKGPGGPGGPGGDTTPPASPPPTS
ncbi:antitoxin [Streptomyces griseorubiginosus]|uniref:antitoxin n=1 Tax=Streptomyces griseorubiginosus TaxID=67304 RepID=UPI0036ED3FA8